MDRFKIMLVAGARPNFMKIASIVDSIREHNQTGKGPYLQHRLVHTGQHYGQDMSDVFFQDLGMPRPDVDLEVGSLSHAHQTAEIMKRFEDVLLKEVPDCVVVVGDVNSTVACSLVASKILYPTGAARSRPLIAHVEAGLRSFDRSMPEEINRLVTDALSDLLFITEPSARRNLTREGVPPKKIFWAGNTMVDTLLRHLSRAADSAILANLGLTNDGQSSTRVAGCRPYAVLTLHRPSNVDDAQNFRVILEALKEIAANLPVVFPVHPRTQKRIREFGLESEFAFQVPSVPSQGIACVPPLGYLDFLCLMSNARLVLTDSGGIQEETTVLGVPCVTLRKNTERPVTVTSGTNVLAGMKKDDIVRLALSRLQNPPRSRRPRYWDGKAGHRIIEVLAEHLRSSHA
ncbi:MAG: UDP-N-acetylglucosamine 2-epimerase (non-hydrolyzing) [Acidobacteriota bacterium]